MLRDDALVIAEDVISLLKRACKRIEIAGSIRRGKEDVKDIEIVAVPDFDIQPTFIKPEFGKPLPEQYKSFIDELLLKQRDMFKIKIEKSGDKYKKFSLVDWGISVDLFLVTPPATWGVQYLIRTGPAEFSHWMVTKKKYGGALPNDLQVKDGAIWDTSNQRLKVPEETDYFELCGLSFIEPSERVAKWKR